MSNQRVAYSIACYARMLLTLLLEVCCCLLPCMDPSRAGAIPRPICPRPRHSKCTGDYATYGTTLLGPLEILPVRAISRLLPGHGQALLSFLARSSRVLHAVLSTRVPSRAPRHACAPLKRLVRRVWWACLVRRRSPSISPSAPFALSARDHPGFTRSTCPQHARQPGGAPPSGMPPPPRRLQPPSNCTNGRWRREW